MCKIKSAIILKEQVFLSDSYDSHTDLLKELKIKDTAKNAETLFVRAELFPKNEDVFSNVDDWVFMVDQDIIPKWFVKDYEEQRMREEVKKWHKRNVFVGIDDLEFKKGTYYFKNCKNINVINSTVTACGNSTVTACDNSTVIACGNSTVTACGNLTVTAYGNSIVTAYKNLIVIACGNSTVTAYKNSTVTAYGNSTVTIPDFSNNKKENITLKDNSTLKDCVNKTIYQSGDFKFVKVEENKND